MLDKVHAEALRRLEEHAAAVFGRPVGVAPTFGLYITVLPIGFECDAAEVARATLEPMHVPCPSRKGMTPAYLRTDSFENGDADHQAAVLIAAFDQVVAPNIGYCADLAALVDAIPAADLALLDGFTATTAAVGPGYWRVDMEWRGLGKGLREGKTLTNYSNIDGDWKGLAATLDRAIARQRRLRRLVDRGITMEAALFRKLRSIGADIGDFVEKVVKADLADMKAPRRYGFPCQTIDGHKIHVGIVDGHIRGAFSLTDAVSWKQGSVVITGMTLPDTVRTACKGQAVRQVVDHPWLEGYTVSSVCQSGETVTIQTIAAEPIVLAECVDLAMAA